jgi:hypothetical protein
LREERKWKYRPMCYITLAVLFNFYGIAFVTLLIVL